MNTLAAPAGHVTSLKSILATGEKPDADLKEQLIAFLENLESKAPTTAAIPSQPDITDNSAQGPPVDRFVTMRQLPDITAYSKRSLLRMVAAGTFPEPIRMSARRNVWRLSAVKAWMDSISSTVTAKEQGGHLKKKSA